MRENVTFKIVNILLICYINCTRKGIWKPDKTNQPAKKKKQTPLSRVKKDLNI